MLALAIDPSLGTVTASHRAGATDRDRDRTAAAEILRNGDACDSDA